MSKRLAGSSFGMAASHVSIAPFEVSQMACARFTRTGTRAVAILQGQSGAEAFADGHGRARAHCR